MDNTKNSTSRKKSPQNNGEEEKPSLFHNATPGEKPCTDAGYFELLSFSIFSSAVGNRKALSERWPDILYGFKSFHVQRVAEFDQADLREVGERVPLLRDKPQLSAVIANAAAIVQISQVYGSFQKYLRSFEKDGPAELLKDMGERFKQVDRSVVQDFLKSAGSDIKFPDPPGPAKVTKPSRRGARHPGQRPPSGGANQTRVGRTQPTKAGRQLPNKVESEKSQKDKAPAKGQRSRRRRFSWRKKKAAGANTAKAEKA